MSTSKTDKKCAHCEKLIVKRGNSTIVNFTNIEHPDKVYFFCSKSCKMIWLAERPKEEKDNSFACKYNCGKVFEKKKGATTHETWCDKNPNSRTYVRTESMEILEDKNKVFTIEEIREIDRAFKLSDEQIAGFVRRGA